MPALDFKEIPSARATKANPGVQDTFELFARDVLDHIGFKVVSDPNRGPDQGKDLIVEEVRRGVGGETILRWLVSCKHFAHNGKSVAPEDEINILERVKMHDCKGFLGFYSTVQSTGLGALLNGFQDIDTQVYDRERIERTLLGSANGVLLAKRFFPDSIERWKRESGEPVDVMVETAPLLCAYTSENLLTPKPRGIIVFVRKPYSENTPTHYEDIYWCLKGEPDRLLENHYRKKGFTTEWEDIPDVLIPTIYLKWCMTIPNQIRSGTTYSDDAYDKIKRFLIATFPYVSRELRSDQKERIDALRMVPSWIGGLG